MAKKRTAKMSVGKAILITLLVIFIVAVVYCGVCGGFALAKGTTWTSEFLSFCGAIKSTVATTPATEAVIGLGL